MNLKYTTYSRVAPQVGTFLNNSRSRSHLDNLHSIYICQGSFGNFFCGISYYSMISLPIILKSDDWNRSSTCIYLESETCSMTCTGCLSRIQFLIFICNDSGVSYLGYYLSYVVSYN